MFCQVVWKNLNIGRMVQTFQPLFISSVLFFIPAILKTTIDFYHFIALSLTLTLAVGDKVSKKQNRMASCTHFSIYQNEI